MRKLRSFCGSRAHATLAPWLALRNRDDSVQVYLARHLTISTTMCVDRLVVLSERKADPIEWTVTDDWPNDVPVTEAEMDVFEAWFGDVFDTLFATRH